MKKDCWGPSREVPIRSVRGGVQESAFMATSQVMPTLRVPGPHFAVLYQSHQITFPEETAAPSLSSHFNALMARDVAHVPWPVNHFHTRTCFWCSRVWLAVTAKCYRAHRVTECGGMWAVLMGSLRSSVATPVISLFI